MRRRLAGWRARARRGAEQWAVTRGEWRVERDLERVVAGDAPILVGPWLSEVGYEVLYWAPFVRWVAEAYRLPPDRLIVMSRGGTAAWYGDVAARYVEVFEHATPAELAGEAAAGRLKQRDESALDRRLVADAVRALGVGGVHVLHPSLMFRWFSPYWSGHEGTAFVERHTRIRRVDAASAAASAAGSAAPMDRSVDALLDQLPDEYVAVKFYAARALPDEPAVQAQVQGLIAALAERWPVVQLDTGLAVDEHADYRVAPSARIISLAGRLDPRTNLAVQSRIIAGARLFAGTCGSLAWLAPLLGTDSVPVFTDASFLHAHLHVARRAYGRARAAQFAPLDIGGLTEAGLAIAAGALAPAVTRQS